MLGSRLPAGRAGSERRLCFRPQVSNLRTQLSCAEAESAELRQQVAALQASLPSSPMAAALHVSRTPGGLRSWAASACHAVCLGI